MLLAGTALFLASQSLNAAEKEPVGRDTQKQETATENMAKVMPIAFQNGMLKVAFGDTYTVQISKEDENGIAKIMRSDKLTKGIHDIHFDKDASYKFLDANGNKVNASGFTAEDIEIAKEHAKLSPDQLQQLIIDTENNWSEKEKAGGSEQKAGEETPEHHKNYETSEPSM